MGSYNTNTLTGWNYTQNIDGWVGGNSPNWSSNTFANAYHGKQYLDVHGNNNVTSGVNNILSQTITTVPGTSYTISFQWGEDVGHNSGETVTLGLGILDASNGTIYSETLTTTALGVVDGIIGPKTWFSYSQTFVATTTQTTIQFGATPPTSNGGAGAALDLVSVTNSACSNDIDNDGIPNHLDLDSDNDGIPDLVEAGGVDINGDGVIDAINTDGTLVNDANNDGYDDHSATNNSGNPDTDNDGIPNSQDLDSDNDGIPDVVEAGGIDNNGDGRADGFADTDNDGFNDLVDGDVDGVDNSANALIITGPDNGNGQPDSYPNGNNKDDDGFPDFLDLDSDNDGIPDIIEAGGIDNNGDGVVDNATDVDQDGLADIYDQDTTDGPGPDGTDGIALVKTDASGNMISGDGNSIDTDGDGLPNHLDIDSDNDGIPDLTEAGGADTNNDGVVDDLTDADGDGLADVYDTDDDGTPGVEDTTDALLQTAGNDANGNGKADDTEITFVNGYNQNADTDRDGLPNYVDLDSDNDGIADLVEAGGVDTDGNGLVDNINTDGTLKIDTDGDGLDDTYQTNEGGHPIGNLDSDNDDITDYKDLDSDNDGIPDVVEAGGTDVNGDGRADGFIDADNDGFNDLVDGDVNGTDNSANALIITGTDSDNDGKPDTYTTGDNDGDGIPNHLDIDSDNDGITDITEAGGSDANRDGIADDFRDDDKDGFNDLVDGDPTNVLDVTVDTAGANTANALVLTGTDGNNDGKPDTYTTGDFDNDGKLDFLDIDADNDGIPDNIEGQPTRDYVAPSGMATDITDTNNNGLDDNYEVGDAFGIAPENTDGTDNVDYLDTDSDNDGILDAVENGDTNNTASGTDSDGDGLDDSFERADIDDAFDVNDEIDIPNKDSLGDEDNDATSIGDVDYRDATSNGIPMITQVYQVGTERWIEITNIGVNDIPANLIKVQLYQNRTGNQTIAPTTSYTITTVLEGGKSVLFKNATDVITNLAATATEVTNNTLTDIGGANDMITLSSENDATSWENRYDVISNFTDNTSFVRIDQTLVPNKDYDSTEWVVFIKDDITTFSNNTDAISERHAHDPLLSEIIGSDSEANTLLGLHRVNITTNSGTTWSNGFPDRSRYVVVDGNYTHSANRLSARKLEVKENSTLTIDNNLLVVTNDVILTNIDDEIRLAGSSQFIQTHTDATKIYGLGKLLVDQNSTVPSLYRYNYMSSPVTSNNNGSNYTLKSVFKDGTKPLSASSAVLDINFIGGYDGNYNASPIEIARYWFYTFSPSADGRSNWAQRDENATISAGDGFIFKGPGRQQNYTFYGKPNDGNLNVSNVGADQSYLVGNPFASAISAKKFIQDNLSSITGTLYFWQHAGEVSSSAGTSTGHNFAGYIGGYGTRTIDMGVAANATTINDNNGTSGTGGLTYTEPGAFIPIGQGFFIEGDDSNGGPVVFNNSQREFIGEDSGQSVFFKSQKTAAKTTISQESTVQLIKLGMDFLNEDNISLHRQIGVSFNPNNSFAFEKGYDAETYDTGATDIYWKFPSDDTKYVISGVQEITSDLEVPLEITMGYTGEVSITLDEIKNIDATIFILDKVTGNSYEVQSNKAVINLDKGVYTDRFVLAFEPNTTLAVDNTIDNLYTNIYADNKNHQLVIANSFDVNITNVKLYNLLGEQVSTWIIKEQNNNHQLNFKKQIPTGIYIVKINTSKGEVNKKIVIE